MISDWYPSPEEPSVAPFIRDHALTVSRRWDVTVVAPASDRAPREYCDDGVEVLRLPSAFGGRRVARLRAVRALNSVIAELAETARPPQLIHAHVFSAGAVAILAGRRRGLPVVLSEHLSDVLEGHLAGWNAAVARFAYRNAQLVCPVSSALAQRILYLEPRARVEVVENTVDVDPFAQAAQARRSSSGSQILVVARLVEKKGVADLIAAFRALTTTHPRATLEIIGDGPDRSVLEKSAEGLPISFVGARERGYVARRMATSDLLVVPSHTETFGIAALEGLAAGTRVLVTTVVPVAGLVEEFGGLVVPPRDHAALTAALAHGLTIPFPEVSVASRLREKFGAEALAERWADIYESVLGASCQVDDEGTSGKGRRANARRSGTAVH